MNLRLTMAWVLAHTIFLNNLEITLQRLQCIEDCLEIESHNHKIQVLVNITRVNPYLERESNPRYLKAVKDLNLLKLTKIAQVQEITTKKNTLQEKQLQ